MLRYFQQRNENLICNTTIFHERFSVLSTSRSQFQLKIFKCSHRHYSESIVYKGPMIEGVVSINSFTFYIVG